MSVAHNVNFYNVHAEEDIYRRQLKGEDLTHSAKKLSPPLSE